MNSPFAKPDQKKRRDRSVALLRAAGNPISEWIIASIKSKHRQLKLAPAPDARTRESSLLGGMIIHSGHLMMLRASATSTPKKRLCIGLVQQSVLHQIFRITQFASNGTSYDPSFAVQALEN